MQIAIVADIHANFHALKAVLKDIASLGMDRIVCAGDVVGYGAHPAQCVDLLRKIGCPCVMGNHDFYTSSEQPAVQLALQEPEAATNGVWAGIIHARRELDADQLAWLAALPPLDRDHGAFIAHAAFHDFSDWPYLLTLDDALPTLALLDKRIGFFGHTHRENIFCAKDGPRPEQIDERTHVLPADTSVAVTVGSVGQPREGDCLARWLAWEPETRTITFHRVPYDHEAAAVAILAAGLPEKNAARLLP